MANPNSTVAAFRNQKWHVVPNGEFRFDKSWRADQWAKTLRDHFAERKDVRVRQSSYRWGSFSSPSRTYMVRVYSNGEATVEVPPRPVDL